MAIADFRMALSQSNFLFGWQKDRLMGMLDGIRDEADIPVRAADVLPVIDNILWRTVGVGLDLMPVNDRMNIERAIREVVVG